MRGRRVAAAILGLAILLAPVRTAFAVDCYEEIDPYYWTFDVPSMIHVWSPADAVRVRTSVIDYMWGGRGFPDTTLPAQVQHLPCDGDPPPVRGPYPADLPATIPGLVLWTDASSVLVQNGRVVSWLDKSGHGNNAVQADVARQPRHAPVGIGGQPALSFDGIDDELNVGANASLDIANMTLFIVLRPASVDNVSRPVPLAKLPQDGAYHLMIDADNTPVARINVGYGPVSTQEMDPVGGAAELWTAAHDGRELRLFRNQWRSELAPAVEGRIGVTSGPLRIGNGDAAAQNAFKGWIAEVILYDRALSDSERRLVEDFLGWKFDIYQAWPRWIRNIGSTSVGCVDRLDVALDYGMHSYAYVLHPKAPVNRVMIYHQGHDDFLLSGGGRETMKYFLDRGFTVAAFWMPLHGETTKTAYDVPGHGTVTFYWHTPMRIMENERGSFIRFFLEPVFVGINHLQATLAPQDINMAGISGGGWTTHLIAALDTRVGLSFPTAGSLPLYLRQGPCPNGSDGDAEQVWSPLYNERASWPDLYALGGYGPSRRQVQVLNQYDSCCFWGVNYRTYEPHVAEAVAGLGFGEYGVYLDSSHHEHKISDPVLDQVIGPAVAAQQLPYRAQTDLTLTQSGSPDPVMQGDALTYELFVGNAGPSKAHGVTVIDTLPASASFVSATPSQGTCVGSGPVTCQLGAIGEGATATVAIVVIPTATGPAVNSAEVSYEFPDIRQESNASAEIASVGRPGDQDGDGVVDEADCAPLDGAAFGLPTEVAAVRFPTDAQTLAWDSAAPAAGYGTIHDLLRGDLRQLPVGSGAAETCVAGGLKDPAATDGVWPAPGEGAWYLVRGRNACGTGTYGWQSGGAARESSACP